MNVSGVPTVQRSLVGVGRSAPATGDTAVQPVAESGLEHDAGSAKRDPVHVPAAPRGLIVNILA